MRSLLPLLCILIAGCNLPYLEKPMPVILESPLNISPSVTIANWNLQVFGPKKASNPELLKIYAEKIEGFDIVFIQEIRDASQTAFPKLCILLPAYNCLNSSRAGRTRNKEQIGLIYKKEISLLDWQDFNHDPEDRWERPPIRVQFQIENYTFTVYNIHIKPSDVQQELGHLEALITGQGNVILLGDLNADCNYYDPDKETEFNEWHWTIKDAYDTTSSKTDCAYDRILLNDDAFEENIALGISTKNITKEVSDHYLIWTQLKI